MPERDHAQPGQDDERTTPPRKRPYHSPSVQEFGSVSKLTTAKTGTPVDGGMPMSTCL